MEGGRNLGTYLPARRGGSPAEESGQYDKTTTQLSYQWQAEQVTCKT